MKKNHSFILFMIVTLVTAMLFTGCGKSTPTLESFLKDNPDLKTQIDEQVASSGESSITVDITGNDIIYTFDLAGMENITEEVAKSDEIKAALESGLESQADSFKEIASTTLKAVKDQGTEIETVRVVVNYTYGDEVIATQTFEADSE